MAKIFYNVAMAKAIRNVKMPVKHLKMDVRARPNYLALTVYEDNIMEYEESKRMQIMEYLVLCKQLIESYGVRCEIEGIKHAKPKKSSSN
jgi:hypothetical protein